MQTAETRVVFFGTPAFAVPALHALHRAGYQLLVVTRVDKPVGKKHVVTPPPVKAAALHLGIPVEQPRVVDDAFVAHIRAWHPDTAVLAAYGRIIKPNLLAVPKRGFLNIHPSLLPRHRGASPVVGTILEGDTETGVTIMQMDEGLDTGPIVAREKISLSGTETAGQLLETLGTLGASLLVRTLPDYLQGTLQAHAQDASTATLTHILTKEDGRIDWNKPARAIERQIRAYSPWPTSWTEFNGKRCKIITARVSGAQVGNPGTPVRLQNALGVVCGDGNALELLSVQWEGKKPMDGASFANGYAKQLLG